MGAYLSQIENNFIYHAPKSGQPEKYTRIRSKAKELALLIDSECPGSREASLAITKLEESVFWANAAIARNEKDMPQQESSGVIPKVVPVALFLVACLFGSTVFAQPTAKITGPTQSPPGEMVVLSSTGSTGDNLKWIKPEGLQTLQVGCAVLDTQVVFATNKPGVYKFVLIVADKQAAIDYVEHTVTIGTLGNGPGPVPGPAPNPTPAPSPNDPSRWSSLQGISKSGADRINDADTRSKLKATIAAAVLDIDNKCSIGQCPTVDAAKDQVRRSIEATLLTRIGPAAKIDWSLWRKGNQAELDRVGLLDIKDYVAALKSIGSGL